VSRSAGSSLGLILLPQTEPCSPARRRGEDAGEAVAAAREVRECIVGEEGEGCDLGDGRVMGGCGWLWTGVQCSDGYRWRSTSATRGERDS
jgi:hypothetical protein